jgi:transposase InsO family protein
MREWAYGRIFGSSAERTATLAGWLARYNWRRPHGSLNHRPPGDRFAQLADVGGNHI